MDGLMHWIQSFSLDLALLLVGRAEPKLGPAVITSTDLQRVHIPSRIQLLTSIIDLSKTPDSTLTL